MLGPGERVSEPMATMRNSRLGCPDRKRVLPGARSRTTGGLLSTLAMTIGYLGLVAILTMAPFWLQSVAPQQDQPLVCTDFGGSR